MPESAYRNDYLYFTARRKSALNRDTLIFCYGVNIDRFNKLAGTPYGLSSNPVIRGLQRVRHAVSTFAISRGALPKTARGTDCAGLAPTQETWYPELLLIEQAHDLHPDELVRFGVLSLIDKISLGFACGLAVPEQLPTPSELQGLLDGLRPQRDADEAQPSLVGA